MMTMMGEEDDVFFDSREEIDSMSGDSGSNSPENCEHGGGLGYEVWVKKPLSIRERRDEFMKLMGLHLGLDRSLSGEIKSVDFSGDIAPEIDRITVASGAVLGNSDSDDGMLSSRLSMCSRPCTSENEVSEENLVCSIRNLDNGTEFVVDELGKDGMMSRLREVGSNRLVTIDEFERNLGLSPSVQQFMRRSEVMEAIDLDQTAKRRRKGWLRRLGVAACIVDRQSEEAKLKGGDSDTSKGVRRKVRRVRTRSYRKRTKEFSAVYMGQEIQAHEGSIFTMKFSLDGKYLASAGVDGIVRVWQVMECERTDEGDIPDFDPSCIYFTANRSSELSPLYTEKEKMGQFGTMKKTSDAACVVFPPNVFRISEKPIHEFRGHGGDVLDLSWSKNKYLLSSSIDKSVRLWRVGCDRCLKIFSHNNYVTCVQFNPDNENYFISGSIDGKVRIWAIPGCKVVDWTEIKEIVTAVCYRPDGQGAIVGSMTGECRFYDASGNQLQLDAQICLQGKKKSASKRITGFQFSPTDPSKVMVTSADSLVRILDGIDVVCKYRGLRNTGSQISASFTEDGRHIVSASEDSNVYVWNYNSHDGPTANYPKSIWSSEHFLSINASVAIPWCGMTSENSIPISPETLSRAAMRSVGNSDLSHNIMSLPSSDSFSISPGFFLEALPKGSATWPEEKLPTLNTPTVPSAVCKSRYKFVKTSCQNMITSHAWGLVIVTAGLDGRIRSFHNYGLPVRT